jgi:hypothetical protein
MTVKRWILSDGDHAKALIAFLRDNAGKAAKLGNPLQVTVAEYRATRSSEQNAFYWKAVLDPAARQSRVNGQQFSAETWHEFLKAEFLPDTCAKGVDKWAATPNGGRRLVMSTTDLNVAEFTAYIDAAQAYLASEHGVQFDNRG